MNFKRFIEKALSQKRWDSKNNLAPTGSLLGFNPFRLLPVNSLGG
jgi:hypothetical protein